MLRACPAPLRFGLRLAAVLAFVWFALPDADASAAGYRLVGWNNLGMHCMDADFAVLTILPPFNTIQAQLLDPYGKLVKAPGAITVTYEAVADPAGSINTTSAGKTNFWSHEDGLFGVDLAVDQGLGGFSIPGTSNTPQLMTFDPATSEFMAVGIPITPYDDAGKKNPYPMMRLVARDGSGNLLASTNIVLPVSDEMSCKSCHASGIGTEALPSSGWANDPDAERDVRRNILRLHDDRRRDLLRFQEALAEVGYNARGLEATAVEDGRTVLCASCHSSEALPGSGLAGIPPLTQSMHTSMAGVTDPSTGLSLDDSANRSACYTCHPGSKTRCLRGAMGAAVAADGSMAMQCQSCHGGMRDVGSTQRTGWLQEPRCDSCHTGTATSNNGQIRYSSVFRADGLVREAVNKTFATNDNAPAAGLSLYRFSKGHGGLECSSCHGSTHAEFPSSHASDNIQSVATQGHKGVLSECTSCHATTPSTVTGGPHGLHPIGAAWVGRHGDYAEEGGAAACRSCHGSDYRGSVLSRAQADRSFSTDFGTKKFFRGAQIGCYSCHNGPSSESTNPNRPAVVKNATASTKVDTPVSIPLTASDADNNTLTLRVVSQPSNGTAGLSGTTATYYPFAGFEGVDTFTVAAWDGSIESNLATVSVGVGNVPCTPGCELPGGGCNLSCQAGTSHDAYLSPLNSMSIRIPTGTGSVTKAVALSVRNLDATGTDPATVRLDVLDGDCPTGTVASAARFSGGLTSVVLSPGRTASAQVSLQFPASAFSTPSSYAPARCHLTARVVVVDGADPVPSNNEAVLEVSVLDQNDRAATSDPDVVLSSFYPVSFDLPVGTTRLERVYRPRIVLYGSSTSGAKQVRLTARDGTCPAGTVSGVDLDLRTTGAQDAATLVPGRSLQGEVRLLATSTAFATPASPLRCRVSITAAAVTPTGDLTNDSTSFDVTVSDRNDR